METAPLCPPRRRPCIDHHLGGLACLQPVLYTKVDGGYTAVIALTAQQLAAIQALCQEYRVIKLELFGSAARSDFDLYRSDVDLLVEFAPGTDLGPWISRFFELQDRLAALLDRKVDLVMARGLRNPHLMRSIEQDRRVLYAA